MTEIDSIAKLKFKDAAYHFNSASLGITPKSSEDKQDRKGFVWDAAVGIVQQEFSKLLGQPTNTICVFHNTTAGVQRILLRLSHLLRASDATLLLTDFEYPGIVSAVEDRKSVV